MKKLAFIRNDDVCHYDDRFLRVYEFYKKIHLPVIYGVIPGLIEERLVKFLNKEKDKNPQLFDIAQHGWRHKNYSSQTENKYEFGPARSYAQQRQDILKGYAKMKGLFGKNFCPAFIPPYHGYNKDTLKIIQGIKMPVFSAGKRNKVPPRWFLDLPAEISLNDYDKEGNPSVVRAAVVMKEFLLHLGQNTEIMGVVFHHESITNHEEFGEVKLFLRFLKLLEKKGKIQLTLFSSLL